MLRTGTSAIVLALGLSACGGSAPQPAATATPAKAVEQAPPPPPSLGLYVTNEQSGDLSVIDINSGTVVNTIKLGKRPRGIAASPDGTRLYIALSGSPSAGPGVDEKTLPPPDRSADGIGVVDIKAGKLLTVMKSGTDPEQLTVSHDGTRVFVANEDAGQLTVIDTATGNIVDTFKVGDEPEGVSVHPNGSLVYVTSEEDGAVYVVDVVAKKVVKPIKVGPRPRSIAFLPDGSRAYVPSENGATLSLIDTKRMATIKTIKLAEGMRPMGTVMAKDGKHLFVSTGRSKMVLTIDTATNKVVGSVEAGPRPWGIALSADGKTLYTSNGPSNDISVIDVATNTVTGSIPLGFNTEPRGVAFNPSGTTAYVTNIATNTVSVIDVAGGIVTGSIPVDRNPLGIVTSPDGSRIYVANNCGLDPVCATPVFGTVSIIDAHASAVIDTVAVGALPEGIDVDRDGRKLYVTCIGADAVDVIDLTTDLVSEQIPVGNGPGGLGRFLGPPASTMTSTSTTTTSLAPSTIPTTTLSPTTSTTMCPPTSTTSTTCPPSPASTTSTTGAVSTTTSTTLPAAGCATEPVAATFPSIGCRLSALRERVNAESALGALGPKLASNLTRASERLQHAADACAATNVKGARRNLTRTARQFGAYGRPLRGPAATRILLPALRQEFLDAGVWIRDDVQRLRQRVVCPD